MSKINILDANIYNKISAGEVVERPASIVKELIENSIDAGATKINVQVFNGGISKIVVADNGSGIEADDLPKAFLPHATSKITKETDLYDIATLGFRGEALASISAVSNVQIISKTKDGIGTCIKCEGGKITAQGEKGSPDGSYISVENLFFNTPVRAKFLKKPKQEESEITSLIARLILANPNIAIKYSADDKIVYNSTGKGVTDAIFAIYGGNIMNNLIPINQSKDGLSISGFIGKSSFFKANRTYQTIIVNGRWVSNSIVSVALSKSYESYMMKHCFPFAVVYFDLPNEQVDVNVHPNKLEVRFQDSKAIFDFVYHSVSHTLYKDIADLKIDDNSDKGIILQEPNTTPTTMPTLDIFIQNNEDNKLKASAEYSTISEIIIEKLIANKIATPSKEPELNFSINSTQEEMVRPKATPTTVQQQLIKEDETNIDYLSTKIIGKVFNTFIIIEVDNVLYFVDQHAAHERLLFDKFMQQLENKSLQQQTLLIPYIVNVNHQEEQFLLSYIDLLRNLGFEIEQFGNLSFKISAIPAILPDLNVMDFFTNFLSNINSYVQMKSSDLVRDNLAEIACKHAVKGGDDLKKEELISLIKDIASGKVVMQCPHGRPFVAKFTRYEIDKWFKRII